MEHTEMSNKVAHLKSTEYEIPSVIKKKKTTNSNGDLTGFRNLTIDKAPTIPRDRAIFPEITEVTI